MLSFKAILEKKSAVKINPKLNDLKEGEKEGHEGMEKSHGEDCDCMKCEKKRRKGKESDPEVATESAVPGKPAERLGAVTAIPKDEREAALARIKAKTAAKQKEKGMKEAKWYDPMEDPEFDHDEAERTRGQSGKNAKKKKPTSKKESYDSQEEVSKEGNQSIAETETLLTFGEFHEGLDMKTFKANRKKNERKAATADARKRGHEGSEWHNSGRTYSPDEAKSRRANMSDDDRAARHRAAVDPDDDRDENTYSADKTKNPKKQRKQAAMGEARNAYAVGMARAQELTGDTPPLKKSTIKKAHKIARAIEKEEYDVDTANQLWSEVAERLEKLGEMDGAKFKVIGEKIDAQFDESRRMDREGVDRDDTDRKNRTMAAKASLAAKQKRQEVLDKHEKKTGTKLDIMKSPEGKSHAKNFPGSRQKPKERGAKETPAETQRRQTNRQVDRVVKHGYTSKEKKHADAMAKHTSSRD